MFWPYSSSSSPSCNKTLWQMRVRNTWYEWHNQDEEDSACAEPENTHLLCKGKYHLLFHWFGCDQKSKFVQQSSWIQTSQTGCQPYSDTSPFKVSECSLPNCRGVSVQKTITGLACRTCGSAALSGYLARVESRLESQRNNIFVGEMRKKLLLRLSEKKKFTRLLITPR